MKFNFAVYYFTIYYLNFPRFGELLRNFKSVQFLELNETTNGSFVFCSSHFRNRNYSGLFSSKFIKSLFTPRVSSIDYEPEETNLANFEDNVDRQYEEMLRRTFRTTESGHKVFVIQPYIKWGPNKRRLTTPVFQLEESVALIESLSNWHVILKQIVPLTSFKRFQVFGKGKLKEIKQKVWAYHRLITAVFVSINMLTTNQRTILEREFRVPVFDRYNVVIQIFRQRAVTSEARLQVALAEIPFMWYNIKSFDGDIGTTRDSREAILNHKKHLLTLREKKIKKQLKKLTVHRKMIRTHRQKLELPVVAVVGYTNAGKTSLIKALTEKVKLRPKDQLFATLDVTAHKGLLPSNIKVLYIDTIGFISDIPTDLIEPFKVTLEDAVQADVIVHILDVSNPDVRSQSNHVIETLKGFDMEENLLQNIITVANKVDKINITEHSDFIKDMIPVSCLEKTGIDSLMDEIEIVLFQNTGRMPVRIRVWNKGKEYDWLYKEFTVFSVEIDPNDRQFAYMDIVFTKRNIVKFKRKFISSKEDQYA